MSLIESPKARFQPCMDSFLGALSGILKALDDGRDMDELWGLSSLAFRTQIHRTLEPAGLFCRQWDQTYSKLLRRVGYDCIVGLRDQFYTSKDLRELQFAWMNTIEKALEDERPAIAFGLHGPAFGIIYGLDNDTEEYHVSTFMDDKKNEPINVQDVGSQLPPLIFVLIPTGKVAAFNPQEAVCEALKESVEHHLGLEKDENGVHISAPPDLVAGPAAYNSWSSAIETGQVQPYWGASYYAAYYTEARSAAATWLRRLAGLKEWHAEQNRLCSAAAHLENEVESFRRLPGLFPMNQPHALEEIARRTEASVCLRAARAEHIACMELLAELKQYK